MALVTAFETGLLTLTDGSTSFENDHCYAILVNGYEFDAEDTQYSDVSGDELSTAGNYERQALGGKDVIISDGKIVYDCANISFGATVSIGPADGIVILKGNIGNGSPAAADPLLFYAPLNDVQSTDAVFSINVPNGLYEIDIA